MVKTKTKETMSKELTFSEVLKRSNVAIREDRAKRMGTLVKMAYDAKVNDLIKQKIEVESRLDNLMDMSTSNLKTTVNRVDMDNFNADDFITERFRLTLKLNDLDYQLNILEEDSEFYS